MPAASHNSRDSEKSLCSTPLVLAGRYYVLSYKYLIPPASTTQQGQSALLKMGYCTHLLMQKLHIFFSKAYVNSLHVFGKVT